MQKLPKLKKGDIIEITWLDSYTEEINGWVPICEATLEEEKIFVKTVSYFLAKVGPNIRIVADVFKDQNIEYSVNRIMNIPTGCIVDIRKL